MKVNVYDMMMDTRKHPYLQSVRETTVSDRTSVGNPKTFADLIRKAFKADKLPEEYVWLLTCDTKNHITGIFEISHGTANQSLLNPAAVYQRALLAGAENCVLLHNHPSCVPDPSEEDMKITRRLIATGKILGVPIIDHIIIGGKRYFSMMEAGLIEKFYKEV